jgi:hypothetical protein
MKHYLALLLDAATIGVLAALKSIDPDLAGEVKTTVKSEKERLNNIRNGM